MNNSSNTGGILAIAFIVVIFILGLSEDGAPDGYKEKFLPLLEILK